MFLFCFRWSVLFSAVTHTISEPFFFSPEVIIAMYVGVILILSLLSAL